MQTPQHYCGFLFSIKKAVLNHKCFPQTNALLKAIEFFCLVNTVLKLYIHITFLYHDAQKINPDNPKPPFPKKPQKIRGCGVLKGPKVACPIFYI
jgi:hypothetical protein